MAEHAVLELTEGSKLQSRLRKFLPFNHGIPSKNTFARVLASLDPNGFKRCFMAWVQSFQTTLKEVIALDGKTLRKSFDRATSQSAIHMVSAFATSSK